MDSFREGEGNNAADLDRAVEALCVEAETLLDSGDLEKQKVAIRLLRKAARAGSDWAQYSLGLEYELGELLPRSRSQALKWYALSARQGYDSALVNLGRLIANKRGATQEDWKQAVALYRRAAKQGNRNAYYNLGYAFEVGKGVKRRAHESFRWYLKAAEQGDVDAQCRVGYSYAVGIGVPVDFEKAVGWYRQAASASYEPACYNLSLCYKFGDGVKRNSATALRWLQKAASLGHPLAKQALASGHKRQP